MKSAQTEKSYKSPPRKLIRFFEKSRDQWKSKHQAAKKQLKRLQNRVRFLEKGKASWKSRAKELETELARLKAGQQSLEKEVERLKKKSVTTAEGRGYDERLRQVPAYHHYNVGAVLVFVSLVLSAASSLRGAGRTLTIMQATLNVPLSTPSWSTGRLWLLRLGYYKLTRPKEVADDWVWIVDHTIQLGQEKCLTILGVRLETLSGLEGSLSHSDVEPLALLPVKRSNGAVVYQQLAETIAKTGVPREIIGDYGSDLKAGIRRFCQAHPQTCYIYDIKHKLATILKGELQHDQAWLDFTRLATQTKKQVQQTALAALAPPQQRSKARYMNLGSLIKWGENVLTFLEQEPDDCLFDPALVAEKLGWVRQFKEPLAQWQHLLELVTLTETFVRTQGIYREAPLDLIKSLPARHSHSTRTKAVRAQIMTFLITEALKTQPNERLLGSSEVIESVFGKFKRLEHDQAKSGFTLLLLSVAAMVSTTTAAVISQALLTVPTKKVLAWGKKNLGQSVQAKRRQAFSTLNKPEQIPDPFPLPS